MKIISRYKRYIVSVILLGLCAIGMFYYGYKTFYIEEEPTKKTEYSYHFALIAEENDNEYWNLIKKGAETAAAESDIYLDYIAPQKADNGEALALLDRMISAKVDGIITHGVLGPSFIELVHKGSERGIPIMTIDTDVEASERKAYIGSNNSKAGELLGKSIIENTTGEQYIGVVAGRIDSISQQERIDGLKNAIESNNEMHFVTIEASDMTEVGAARATYNLLKEYPEITVLAGVSALDGIGIVEGLADIAPNKNVFIVAFDTLPKTLQWIQEDRIEATIAQYPEEMGYKAVKTMLQIKANESIEEKQYIDTMMIKKEDLSFIYPSGDKQ